MTSWTECVCVYQVVLQLFDASELELLISGMPEIDIDDWAAHTVLQPGGYAADSPQVVRAAIMISLWVCACVSMFLCVRTVIE